MILLACAVQAELESFPERSGVKRIATGVGPVEAACSLTEALCRERYTLLINVGLGGVFESAAQIGDGVVVGEDAIELKLENGMPLALPDGERVIETVRSDPELAAKLHSSGFSILRGVTVSRATATAQEARRLATELGAQVESMEGFAALRVAQRLGVRAIELRGISNRCGDRAFSGWDFGAGFKGLARITNALLDLL